VIRIGVISAYGDEDWHGQQIVEAARAHGNARLLQPTEFGARIAPEPEITVAGEPASHYDLFLTPRAIGERGDAELQLELYRTLAETGAVLVNSVEALTTAIDKFRSSWLFARAGLPTPRVVVAQRLEEACLALAEMRRTVVKPIYGSLGIGIERLDVADAGRLGELLQRHRALYLQAYVEAELDVRAFVIGDRVAAAIARRPKPGEFRANIHQGADAFEIPLDPAVAGLAVRATRAVGLDYSGVDLLLTNEGPQLLEVNGTPAFRGVNHATGRDMAQALVEHAVARAEEKVHGREEGRHDRSRGGTSRRRAGRETRRGDHPRSVRARIL
jgi:tetrahydromethanopterin:alpha-L-glutamate ligase